MAEPASASRCQVLRSALASPPLLAPTPRACRKAVSVKHEHESHDISLGVSSSDHERADQPGDQLTAISPGLTGGEVYGVAGHFAGNGVAQAPGQAAQHAFRLHQLLRGEGERSEMSGVRGAGPSACANHAQSWPAARARGQAACALAFRHCMGPAW